MPRRLFGDFSCAFWMLATVLFLSYMHQGMFNVALPAMLVETTGTEFLAGAVLAAFGTMSFLTRPFVGSRIDRSGSAAVLVVGTAVMAATGLALAVPLVGVVFLANALRGVGWAAINTGGGVMVSEMATPSNRGKLSGIYSLFQSLASSSAPAVTLLLLSSVGYVSVALFAALAATAGFVVAHMIRRLRAEQVGSLPDAPSRETPSRADGATADQRDAAHSAIERRALLPAFLLACLTFSHPAMTSFIPLYGREFNIPLWSQTTYFVVYGTTSVLSRLMLASQSDRVGRFQATAGGLVCTSTGLALLAASPGVPSLLVAAALYGLGQSLVVPALMALVMDRVPQERMGAGMATHSAAFQIGSSAGALCLGWALTHISYVRAYALLVVILVPGLVVCLAMIRQANQPAT